MKFVEPKVVDSLSENGLLLAQDGEDVVKVPVSKLVVPSGGNEDVFFIDLNNEFANEEVGAKLLEAIEKGKVIYLTYGGGLGFIRPIHYIVVKINGEWYIRVEFMYVDEEDGHLEYIQIPIPADMLPMS